ncbi:MAG TPA: AAA family ATPase [Xanthobacteraceae bacterium]|nr:AAA family ATPase [Xanthobacteraceae bacterium]
MERETESQSEVLAFLTDPATYSYHGAHGKSVQRIDTHAASVFLAGNRALKVKRAVQFPFLDYSTLAKRKEACEAELAVNAPYAPEIYRGVVAITREPDGRLAIAGKGTPVEWAVELQRFDETRTLDHLTSEIDEKLADALGKAVAAAHEKAPIAKAVPWITALGVYLDQNLEAFQKMPELFEPEAVTALDRHSRQAYERMRPLLAERGRLDRVRRGHGDLHLGNIALIGGRPVLFDAIEFDPLIAAGDVLYDLAFLLMDLCERGRRGAANIVFNRYLVETRHIEDLDGLAALPLFLSLRAAIRAKVTAARIENAAAQEREAIAQSARTYFTFARSAITPPKQKFVAVGGLSGTGKTRLAQALAPYVPPVPGAVMVRSDVERKVLFGIAEIEKLPRQAYAPEVSARVYTVLDDKARRILAAGHSAIVDAVFADSQERGALGMVAKATNIPLEGLFLSANLECRLARVGARLFDASDADETVVRTQEQYGLGKMDWSLIDASGTVEQTLTRARTALHLTAGGI